ncbi:ABC transporter substrate-binding protein [Gulosibacter faecalis]|jgi:multiple sugar transport system substrate-binding protein|uniref:ABC transporter substrate-binding protein n=1 Tax=Gulosibacter faecalis TaxID=272240 RepID=A0ABW5UXW7_9MICO|nr:ABC transporter substrate-binding protein [Gulosibacter faecalis]
MKRRISAVAAVAVAGLVLAGCSGGGGGGGGEGSGAQAEGLDSRGPISFAMGANDAGKLEPIIEAWNADHPDEEVTLVELPQEANGQRDTLVQSLQAQSGDYDVMALDVTWTAEFAANGWLQPLDGDLNLDTSALLPATVESATYMDTLYAAPQNTNAQLMFYRTDIVDEVPTTWDDLLAYRDAADAENLDLLIMQLKNYEGLTVQTTQAINSWGGSVVDADGKTPTVDSDEAKAGIEALAEAYANGDIPKAANGYTEEQTNLSFLAGETVFAYNWPYMYDTAMSEETSQVKDKFDVAAIVGPDGPGASTLGGYNNGINVYSENKATAFDFVQFILSEENQKGFAEQSFPPVLASIYEDESLIEQFPYLPALKDALDNAQPRPVTPFYAAVSKAIADNAYAAIVEGKPVDEVVTNMSDAITSSTAG